MSKTVTLELSDELAERLRSYSAARRRRLEDVVVDWIGRAMAELSVELMPDDELLALCDATFDEARQAELTQLLARQSEGEPPQVDQRRLDELLVDYRKGLVSKARAWRTAVERGLRPPLDDHAA